ncbi:hypothetical protein Ahy_A07g037155 [Arachis hypogaea]|uniref:LRR receptor-like serine/threonine-protein kinase n=1 Tax=Arachis hypogaea TaxID=3818 RepID=A0A445CHY5_ARAHY|nr:hypothetical protein Ahy_A07g037155 [Arachis hypogaea]
MLTSVMGQASMAINEKIYGLYRVLKSQNSSGTPPPQLARLPYLQEIDLTFNYLNDTIPKQWSSLNLDNPRLPLQWSNSFRNFTYEEP